MGKSIHIQSEQISPMIVWTWIVSGILGKDSFIFHHGGLVKM